MTDRSDLCDQVNCSSVATQTIRVYPDGAAARVWRFCDDHAKETETHASPNPGLPRAVVVQIERDQALLDEDWLTAADLSDELASLWQPHNRDAARGYRHSAKLWRERAITTQPNDTKEPTQ